MKLDPKITFPKPEDRPCGPPLPLLPSKPSEEAYPIDALPPLMREAVEAIAYHVQAPRELAGQCVIGAAAYLAQTRVNAPHHQRPEGMPCSLFMLTLAGSGDRKSECRRLAFRVVDEAEQQARTEYRKQVEAIQSQADCLKGKKRDEYLTDNPPPADPRTQYSDATFEPIVGDMIRGASQACWDTDEGGQVFGGTSFKADTRAATIGGLIRAFDSGLFERTRSRGNAEGSGVAYHRRLSILILAQQVTVAEALNDPLLREQGFLPRFLLSSVQSLAGTRELTLERIAEKSYADARLQRFWDQCRALLESPSFIAPDTGEVEPPVIEMTAGATRVWLVFYNETEREQASLGEFVGIRPFAARAGELARRLAAVLACFAQLELIDEGTMAGACRLVRHSLCEWVRYSEDAQPAIELVQAAELMAWFKEPCRADKWQVFHRNDLGKSGPRYVRKAANRDKLLSVLQHHRHLLFYDGKQFRINPLAEVADSAEIEEGQAVTTAEAVRKAAESIDDSEKPMGQGLASATFRKASAEENTVDITASATSATRQMKDESTIYRGLL